MPFSGASDAANIQAAKWFVENEPRRIQIHGVMPVLGINGGFLVYPRVPAIKPAQVVGPCEPADDISTQVTPARFGMVQYVARVPVCMADRAIYRHPQTALTATSPSARSRTGTATTDVWTRPPATRYSADCSIWWHLVAL